ncbi:ABC transporter permease [Kocuria palustris]|uniref:ABC transporter permease n=1 Tax=Kocuria palustris TaxID=71999 RepID=UPI00119FCF3C|nr:ABC transporter permease subunit [Kocuria palustris]
MSSQATAAAPTTTPPASTQPPDASAEGRRSSRRTRRRGRLQRVRTTLISLVVLILLWWFVTAAGLVQPLFLPSPGAVWSAFVQANSCRPVTDDASRWACGEQGYFLWEHLAHSLRRIAIGVGAGAVVGVALGVLLGAFRPVREIVEPYLHFLRALPPLGYIGLLIVWFGIGDTSKIWLLFLAAFPPIAVATMQGVQGVQVTRVNAARSLGATRWQVMRHVTIPSALPDVIGGIRIATGFTWTTVVAAELNNGIPGIGGLAYVSGTQLQTPLTIACIIVIGLAAVGLDALIAALGRVATPWQGRA